MGDETTGQRPSGERPGRGDDEGQRTADVRPAADTTAGSPSGAIVQDGDGSGSDHPSGTSRGPFNWPALVATLAATSIVAFFVQPPCSWEEDGASVSGPCLARYLPAAEDALVMFVAYAAAPLLVVFGLLGARRKYRSGRWVGAGLAGLGICMVAIYLFWVAMWML